MADVTDVIMSSIQGMRDAGVPEAETTPGDEIESDGGDESTDTENEAPGGDNEAEGEGETVPEGTETTTEEADPDADAVKEPKEGDETAETPEEEFAKEHGLQPPKKGKDNRIPYTRVQKITENAVKKAVATLTATHKTELDTRDARLTEAAGKLEHMETVGRIIMTNPEQYLELLPQVNPKFAELFDAMKAGAAPAEPDAEEPKPDLDLGNGRMTYSMEGLAKLRAYDRQQAAKLAEASFDKRLKPIETERQTRAREAQEKQIETDAIAHVNSTIEKARAKWVGFKENEAEIFAALKKDRIDQAALNKPPTLDLHDAYEVVMGPKRQLSEKAMRTKLLAELKKAPASTQVVAKTPAARVPAIEQQENGGEDRVTAAIKRSVAQMKKGMA